MLPLTKRQAEVLAFIEDYITRRGFSPTLREIAAALGLRSLATVHKHIANLQWKGRLTRAWNYSRAITVTISGECCPTCGAKVQREKEGESAAELC